MAFVIMTKPSVGDPAKKTAFADAVIDNLIDLNARLSGVSDAKVNNGDMELDQDADGVPDGFTWTAYAGGSVAISTAKQFSGGKSVAITQPAGALAGGGYLTSTNYISVEKGEHRSLRFGIEVTRAASQNKVEVLWYDSALALISTAVAYDSVSNPTTMARQVCTLAVPATAVWAKLKFHGGLVASTGANITYYDSVEFEKIPLAPVAKTQVFLASGTFTVPPGVTLVYITGCGGGGGGAGGYWKNSATYTASGGGGGAGAAVAIKRPVVVVAEAAVTVTIGAGGAGGITSMSSGVIGTAAGAGVASSFGSFSIAGGPAGTTAAGGGGVGGVAVTASLVPGLRGTDGAAGGFNQSTNNDFVSGGAGGLSHLGTSGAGGSGIAGGTAAGGYGGGGGGAGGATAGGGAGSVGGAGAPGIIIVEW